MNAATKALLDVEVEMSRAEWDEIWSGFDQLVESTPYLSEPLTVDEINELNELDLSEAE